MLCLSLQSSGGMVHGAQTSEGHGPPPPRPPLPHGTQTSGSHGPPPPRPPPPVLPTSPTARTAMKRPSSHGPHLAAIEESSFSQSQQEGQNEQASDQSGSRDDEWVMLQAQISTESAESHKPQKSVVTNSQSIVDECMEATEDMVDSPKETNGAKKSQTKGVDLEDIDAIVAEFEQLRKQSEARDAEIDAQHTAGQRLQSDSTDVSESEAFVSNTIDGTVEFKPKKPLGFSKSLPVPNGGKPDNLRHDHDLGAKSSQTVSGVTAASEDNLLGKEQTEELNYCEWDKDKKEQSKKRRGGSFFNKWRNRDKPPIDSENKSPHQFEPNTVSNQNSHSENDLLNSSIGRTVEHSDQGASLGIMRRLSKMVKNQAEDSDDGAGSSAGTPRRRKSRLDQKICFIDLSMEDVPKNAPTRKMTYGDHVHVGMCQANLIFKNL